MSGKTPAGGVGGGSGEFRRTDKHGVLLFLLLLLVFLVMVLCFQDAACVVIEEYALEDITSSQSSKRVLPLSSRLLFMRTPSAGRPGGLMQSIRRITMQAPRMMIQEPSRSKIRARF